MKYGYAPVQQAKQILADETGVIHKDWGSGLPVALVYPNTYQLGMSSLAIHLLYHLFNAWPGIVCERAFWGFQSPPGDDEPLISLESQRPLSDFAVIAFSVSYELDYFNLVHILRRSGIPVLSADRDESWPLVIAGGPAVSANPAPLADILDAVAIGEAEALAPGLLEALPAVCQAPRLDGLNILSQLPGIFVPALEGGPVRRQWVHELDPQLATTQVFTPHTEFGDRALIEIGRGCGRGCRYCMAGYLYRPVREASLDDILAVARRSLSRRDKVGLVSAAVSDHSQVDQLATRLRAMGARLAVSSMRVDPLSEPLLQALAESGTQTLTIAPEAGSAQLRQVINKPQTEEQLLHAVDRAAGYNFSQLKLYFMVGQPAESEADVEAIADLVLAVRSRFARRLTINATPYVPKAQTPFQWSAMLPVEQLRARVRYLERRLQPARVTVRSDSPAWAAVEGVLARGDRRLGQVLARMPKTSLRTWQQALQAEGLDQQDYLRQRALDEPLPWSVIDGGVRLAYLRREVRRAWQGRLASACKVGTCLECGACVYPQNQCTGLSNPPAELIDLQDIELVRKR
jgi:radical SAM superfamily enzyme YgiQ (UPF0313 family)